MIKAIIENHQSLDKQDLYFRPKTPKAGSWSDWGSWQPQGSDRMIRTRACDSPAPMLGGKCEGEAEEIGNIHILMGLSYLSAILRLYHSKAG